MKPCSEDGCLLTISSDRTHHERARTFGKGHDVSVPQNALGTTNANLGNREVGVAQRDIVERTGSQRNSGASNAIRPLRKTPTCSIKASSFVERSSLAGGGEGCSALFGARKEFARNSVVTPKRPPSKTRAIRSGWRGLTRRPTPLHTRTLGGTQERSRLSTRVSLLNRGQHFPCWIEKSLSQKSLSR